MKCVNYIMVFIAISFTVFSCNRVEPIGVEVKGNAKPTSSLEYKNTKHLTTLSWMTNWTADGSKYSYLSSLPDSLDVVVVSMQNETLNVRQKKDYDNVKKSSATKVVLFTSLDMLVESYLNSLEDVFDLVIVENPDLDEDNAEDMARIKELVAEKEQQISEKFSSDLEAFVDRRIESVKSNQFDGISLHITNLSNPYVRKTAEKIITNYKKNNPNLMLVFEGDYKKVVSIISQLDYVVDTSNIANLKSINDEFNYLSKFEGFEPSKLLLYSSMYDSKWNIPFDDIITSEDSAMYRIYSIANWRSNDGVAVGMAVRFDDNDMRDGYPILRNCIQYVSHK